MASLDWGSVPGWVGTVVTSSSAALAVVSYRRSLQDRAKEQASKISVWSSPPHVVVDSKDPRRLKLFYDVKVVNHSTSPVYSVEMKLPEAEELYEGELPDWHEPLFIQEIGGGQEAIAAVSMSVTQSRRPRLSFLVRALPTPTLTFTDALGRRWSRDRNLALTAVKGDPRRLPTRLMISSSAAR